MSFPKGIHLGESRFFVCFKQIVPLFGFRSCGIQKGGTSSLRSSSQRDPLGAMTFSEVLNNISEVSSKYRIRLRTNDRMSLFSC